MGDLGTRNVPLTGSGFDEAAVWRACAANVAQGDRAVIGRCRGISVQVVEEYLAQALVHCMELVDAAEKRQ